MGVVATRQCQAGYYVVLPAMVASAVPATLAVAVAPFASAQVAPTHQFLIAVFVFAAVVAVTAAPATLAAEVFPFASPAAATRYCLAAAAVVAAIPGSLALEVVLAIFDFPAVAAPATPAPVAASHSPVEVPAHLSFPPAESPPTRALGP